jgi:hypothetical protein
VIFEVIGKTDSLRQRAGLPRKAQLPLMEWSGRAPGPCRQVGWQEAPNESSGRSGRVVRWKHRQFEPGEAEEVGRLFATGFNYLLTRKGHEPYVDLNSQ